MGFEQRYSVKSRGDRAVGNIYERLNAARRKREEVLEVPIPANVDQQSSAPCAQPKRRPFPTLKPPRSENTKETLYRNWEIAVPWLLGLAIFALIFWFAVS
ncbi:MAG: hypothetical protein AAFR73_01055 [Pseudomonadota bacterium]